MSPPPTVMWFRRDLRTWHHAALAAAAAEGPVVPLFVVDPRFVEAAGPNRAAFLAGALAALHEATDGTLVVQYGDPTTVVPRVADELGARTVHVSRDAGPYGRARDSVVADRLRAGGRHLVGTGTPYLVAPGTVTKADGTPYAVFTPFSKVWREHLASASRPPESIDVAWEGALGDPLPAATPTASTLPEPTPLAASKRWRAFRRDGLDEYHERRDLPAVEGTSRMSAHLKWGTVHPAQLLDDLDPSGDAHRVFLAELAWREFYADVLMRRPETAWQNLDRRMDAMPVDTDAAAVRRFDRWRTGTTGFAIVDAGMRELRATGWMHNRVRMIVASFLVKDLHLPWQWGARHFMTHLVDGDLSSNSHGWQWAAGTGTDAAPYFRVFNPAAQQARYDPDGEYVARWVPELGTSGYPAPMVDHAAERLDALERYRTVGAR
jgi:deoxyribodipyrimidine photo-lyase